MLNAKPLVVSLRVGISMKSVKSSQYPRRIWSAGRLGVPNARVVVVVERSIMISREISIIGATPRVSESVDRSPELKSEKRHLNCVLTQRNSEPPRDGSTNSSRSTNLGRSSPTNSKPLVATESRIPPMHNCPSWDTMIPLVPSSRCLMISPSPTSPWRSSSPNLNPSSPKMSRSSQKLKRSRTVSTYNLSPYHQKKKVVAPRVSLLPLSANVKPLEGQ